MATYKTQGLVLKRINLGESDRIVTFLTPDRGLLRGVARGVRKISSRLGGHLELFCVVELMLAEGRSLDVLTSARLIRHYDTLSADYDRLRYAYVYTAMFERLLDEGMAQPAVYELALEVFGALATTANLGELELYAKLHLLDLLGYRPELDKCVICLAAEPQATYFLNAELGGIVDGSCRSEILAPISHEQIKYLRWAVSHDWIGMCRVGKSAALAEKALPLVEDFYEYHFGRHFVPMY